MIDQPPPPVPLNPYAPPAAAGAVDDGHPAHDMTEEEAAAFVGDRRRLYYWRAWRRGKAKSLSLANFNWAAMFFNLFWLLYRKMLREFWILTGVYVLIEVALIVVARLGELNLNGLGELVGFGLSATVGLSGDALYLRRAQQAVTRVRREQPEPQQRLALLRRAGGVSLLYPLAGLVAAVALGYVAATLSSSAVGS